MMIIVNNFNKKWNKDKANSCQHPGQTDATYEKNSDCQKTSSKLGLYFRVKYIKELEDRNRKLKV